MIKSIFDLEVFNLSYQLAMEIFNVSRSFPKEERYSLTDQVVLHPVRSLLILLKDGVEGYTRMNLKNILFMAWALWKKRRSGYILQKIALICLMKISVI